MGAQRHRGFRVEQGVGLSDNFRVFTTPNCRPRVLSTFEQTLSEQHRDSRLKAFAELHFSFL